MEQRSCQYFSVNEEGWCRFDGVAHTGCELNTERVPLCPVQKGSCHCDWDIKGAVIPPDESDNI